VDEFRSQFNRSVANGISLSENAAANSIARLQNDDGDACLGQGCRRGKAGNAGTDDDYGFDLRHDRCFCHDPLSRPVALLYYGPLMRWFLRPAIPSDDLAGTGVASMKCATGSWYFECSGDLVAQAPYCLTQIYCPHRIDIVDEHV